MSVKRSLCIMFLLMMMFNNIFAQKGILNGKVTDVSNSEPLIGVNIIVVELENTGTATDINSYFEIALRRKLFT